MTDASLFRIEKVTPHCFAAIARPVPRLNCNAGIVVTSEWILVVDTHSRPSAARALIAHVAGTWPNVPIRYVVNSHFHWDHVQGNVAYKEAFGATVELISTDVTCDLMRREGQKRLRQTIDSTEAELDELRRRDKSDTEGRIGGLDRYCREMSGAIVPLPTHTFGGNFVVRSRELAVHLLAPGRGHTAGDLIVYLPTEGVIITGDLLQGIVPYLGDAYPDEWICTLDLLAELQFDSVIPGHGRVQSGRGLLALVQGYLRSASEMVLAALEKGTPIHALEEQFLRRLNRRSNWSSIHAQIVGEMEQVFGKSSEELLDQAIRESLRDAWDYYSGHCARLA